MSGTSLPLHGSHRAATERSHRTARSPFGPTAPAITAALAHAVVAAIWLVVGDGGAPGRWVPVHLFTLGVLTNLVLVFTEHFGRTLTRQPDTSLRWQAPAVNVGIVAMLVGLPTGTTWALAAGASIVSGVVMASWWRLRAMRHAAVGARFTWTATLVFFGPTLTRTRIEEGADAEGARALRVGAAGLTVGVLLLLATGVGGTAAVVLRLAAAAGLGLLAWAATVTCLPVVQAALGGNDPTSRWPVVAVGTWLPLVMWADVIVVATGAWRFLDALGLAIVLGVLLQAMAATLTYLAPMLRGRTAAARERLRGRLGRGAAGRTTLFNLGTVVVVASALVVRAGAGGLGVGLTRAGRTAVLGPMAWLLVASLWRQPRTDDEQPAPGLHGCACGPSDPDGTG